LAAERESPPMLRVEGVNQFYGGSHILRDVGFETRAGEVCVVLGRNGVGKTTLLRSIIGTAPVATGRILLDGVDCSRLPSHLRVRMGMGYVPQGREIFARLTVEENLRMGLAPLGREAPIPDEVFELFPVLEQMRRRRGGDLSGGQQQQLAIARALVAEPRLIILDEPTEGIQPSIIKDIGRVIHMLRQRGDIAILLCEQYFDFARELADRFVVLSRGEVVASGDRAAIDGEDVRRHLSV